MTCKRMTRVFEEVDGHPWRSWYLAGPAGSAELLAAARFGEPGDIVINGVTWVGWMLGMHTPRFDRPGHDPLSPGPNAWHEPGDRCLLVGGSACFFEASARSARAVLREWAESGDGEVIWQALAELYIEAERLAVEPVGR